MRTPFNRPFGLCTLDLIAAVYRYQHGDLILILDIPNARELARNLVVRR